MCAIIDANVAHEVFGENRPEAGVKFFEWIEEKGGRLVAGGKLLAELYRTPARMWVQQRLLAGEITTEDKNEVNAKTDQLHNEGSCKSDDPHVIALAQVSGARLLYSNDGDLQEDFGNKNLIDRPRGKVYSTRVNKDFQPGHKKLLENRNLCRPPN